MTGTSMNVITKNNIGSYNIAVNAINKHQKENVGKLESALTVANNNNSKLTESLSTVNNSINQLKKQIYINQCLIDNWNLSAPYTFPTDLLQ